MFRPQLDQALIEEECYVIEQISFAYRLLQRLVVEQCLIQIDRPIFYGNDAVWNRTTGEIPTLQVEAEVSNRKWLLEVDMVDW